MRKIDLSGDTYGDWMVIEESDVRKNKKVYWKCKCLLCGKIRLCSGNNLRTGKTKHCGCKLGDIRSASRTHDLSGQKFGKLTVVSRNKDAETYGRTMWNCICECGTNTIVSGVHLTRGATRSCGCCKQSVGENKIAQLLSDAGISFIPHYYVNINGRRYYYDFYVNNQYFIEYDGIQHYIGWNRDKNDLMLQIERDMAKTNYCSENNIPLIRVPYTSLDKLCLNDLLIKEKSSEEV